MPGRNPLFRLPFLLLPLSLVLLDAAPATVIGWAGDFSGSWTDGTNGSDTNWSTDGFPQPGDAVVVPAIFDLFSEAVLDTNAGPFSSLTVSGVPEFFLNPKVALRDGAVLTIQGPVTLGANPEHAGDLSTDPGPLVLLW